jgi:NADH dehydrogenase [ubiquinone] 1 alpha subcomplex assembly factor 7
MPPDERSADRALGDDRTPDERIREEIASSGPIAFDRFMELSLYGPGGFFERETPPVGQDADFVTSPHVHPLVFSRCLRAAILDGWSDLGEPDQLELVELGAGDGTLAAALLEAFDELPSPAIAYTAVERGSGSRARLAELDVRVAETVDDLEPFEGIVVANELLDNLPFRLTRRDGEEIREIRIGIDGGGRLARVTTPWMDDRSTLGGPTFDAEGTAVIPVGIAEMLGSLGRRLRRGVAILIDYGGRGTGGPVHGYAEQRGVDDVLMVEPGTTDVTAGVDLDAVARLAADAGLRAWEPVRQAVALEALGYARWDATMRASQRDAQREHDPSAARIWASRSRASLLVDPARLGALWWIVLTTPELPEPTWLANARRSDD